MGINYLFDSNINSQNNNQLESSNDMGSDIINNKRQINDLKNGEDILSNKEFYQHYLLSLTNITNKNVILLGDSKIGKTKLFNLILGNNDNNEKEINTEQNFAYFEEKTLKINGLEINVNVWDTPGKPKHQEANKHFIKDCIISYLCFHFKIKKSLENIKNYYINLVREINGKNTFIVLVGIKNKIIEDEDDNGDNITINMIKNLAENNNVLYYIVSLDDNNSVNYFFYDSIKQYSLYKARINYINKN